MTVLDARSWVEQNETALHDAITALLRRLDAHARDRTGPDGAPPLPPVPSIDVLARLFDLSEFERSLLLLAAAVEMSRPVALACAACHVDAHRPYATFGLALAVLPGAHWSAITPDAPLRRFRLLHVDHADSLTSSPLRPDERILHLVAGVDEPDAQLTPFATITPWRDARLPASQQGLVDTVVDTWRAAAVEDVVARARAVQLYGADRDHLDAVAHGIAGAIGAPHVVHVDPVALPAPGHELDGIVARLERECILTGAPLVVEPGASATGDTLHTWFVRSLLGRPALTVIVVSRERALHDGQLAAFAVPVPTLAERQEQWRRETGSDDASVDRVAAGFALAAPVIETVVAEARARPTATLWTICRERVRTDVGGCARVVAPRAGWSELVLPDDATAQLADIIDEARHRAVVHEQWGFAQKQARGGGTTALFCGPTGTGKTLAAEVLANALDVDLYLIDLSQVVNKYIGETEKNLARVFDAGERSGAVLLFDEADALFGKRTEVKDSHDRYANIEVSYLLQRMDGYRGVAILTTNLRNNLDAAFVRRLRFIVQFPHPDVRHRRAIWERIFPRATPTAGLGCEQLAQLDVTGGTIKNIALAAAYRAAAAGSPVTMGHLRAAAEGEYVKLDRPITEPELRGWP